MTLTRLVIVALLLCPVALFSQDQQAQSSKSPSIAIVPQSKGPDTLSEPWRIIPPQINLNDTNRLLIALAASELASPDDFVCLKIRSYVVARDSKNSDSVHPVKYSTCQPASRYQLKTTELHETVRQKDTK